MRWNSCKILYYFPHKLPLSLRSETIAGERPDSFYALLDAVTNPEVIPDPAPIAPQSINEFILGTAVSEGYLSEPGSLASVQMALGLHTALPRLEAYYQYYEDRLASREVATTCESWVDWYGHSICDLDELTRVVHTETIESSETMQVEEFPFLDVNVSLNFTTDVNNVRNSYSLTEYTQTPPAPSYDRLIQLSFTVPSVHQLSVLFTRSCTRNPVDQHRILNMCSAPALNLTAVLLPRRTSQVTG